MQENNVPSFKESFYEAKEQIENSNPERKEGLDRLAEQVEEKPTDSVIRQEIQSNLVGRGERKYTSEPARQEQEPQSYEISSEEREKIKELPQEIQDNWPRIPPEARNDIHKLFEETSQLKSSPRTQIDQAISSQRLNRLNRTGMAPAQFIERSFQFDEALSHPDYQYDAIAHLANNYNIDLSVFSDPERLQALSKQMQAQQQQLHQYQKQQQQIQQHAPEAEKILDSFGKENNAQHINDAQVKSTMFAIINAHPETYIDMQKQEIKLADAYIDACYALKKEPYTKKQTAQQQKPRQQQPKKPNKQGKHIAVRDSIRQAIKYQKDQVNV